MKNLFHVLWQSFKKFGEFIASIINFILLLPVYFIGVGLTKLFAKLLDAKILSMHQEQNTQSYWAEYSCKTEQKEKYKRMF